MIDRRLQEALRHLDPPTGFRPWHGGPTVLGALRGVTAEVAAWRPFPDRHAIWDLALHAAYWNYAVERRLTGGAIGAFPRSPANFPDRPAEPSPAAWDRDRRLVRETHARLVAALEAFEPARLDEMAGENRKSTWADLVTGILLHDTYHAGQIQMLKRMAQSAGV